MDPHIGDVQVPDDRVGHRSPSPATPPAPPTGAALGRRDPTSGTWRNRIIGPRRRGPRSPPPQPGQLAPPSPSPAARPGRRARRGRLGRRRCMVNRTTGHRRRRPPARRARPRPRRADRPGRPTSSSPRTRSASSWPASIRWRRWPTPTSDALAAPARRARRRPIEALARMLAELAERNGIVPAGLGDPDDVPAGPRRGGRLRGAGRPVAPRRPPAPVRRRHRSRGRRAPARRRRADAARRPTRPTACRSTRRGATASTTA